ncbi:MAG: hypothetical protein Q7T21_02600 [Gallionella sp.]|nr:hypothetical protein [Gallionella sp.]
MSQTLIMGAVGPGRFASAAGFKPLQEFFISHKGSGLQLAGDACTRTLPGLAGEGT